MPNATCHAAAIEVSFLVHVNMNAPVDQHSNSSLIDSLDGKVHALKQCDFYTNPTILSRLILNQKYSSALNRLKNHPEEASVWVCSKRNPFKGRELPNSQLNVVSRPSMRRLNSKLDPQLLDYSIRQLPIHVACNSLFRCSPQQKKEVERLITRLAVVYPDGCEKPDHNGKLPLHEAIWHNASPETLSVLLMASPSTLHERDKFGRAPMELNRCRSGQDKEQVKDMLLRGVAYWESARDEAVSLTKRNDDKDVLKSISMRLQKGASLGDMEQELVEPITWKKLEQRAIYLEQLLSEMYETNYEMGETVDVLTHENMQLRDEVERLKKETGSNDVGSDECIQDLCEEIDFLRREIARLKSLLKKKNMSIIEEDENFDADAIKYLEWNNMTLQNELQEMTERNRENEVRLARLEIVATKLRKKIKDSEVRQTQPESQGLEGDNKGDTAAVDFMDLLAMLSHQSPLATERYLADKVLRLQEQLNEAGRSVDLSSAASFADSTRLKQENALLQERLSELSIQIKRKSGSPKVGRGSINIRQNIPVGGNPYQTDSLDEMLQQAADLYSTELGDSKEFAFSCFPEPPQGEAPGRESSLSGAFPPEAFPKDATMKAFEANDETGTWDSSHVRQLDTYVVDPTTKIDAKVEPRRLKLVEISTDASEVVSHVPPRRVGPYSDSTERSESITISEVSMDSLIRSKRSLRLPSSSKSSSSTSLMGIPADIIVALRTASFSDASQQGIEPLFLETESVLGRPISDDIKTVIRSRYLAEDGNISKLLLAWLKEALGDSDGSLSLSINDLDSIFAGADKIAEQIASGETPDSDRMFSGGTTNLERMMSAGTPSSGRVLSADSTESGHRIFEDSADSEYVKGHAELTQPRTLDIGSSSGDNPSSVIRRQWAAAFEETARFVSQRRLAVSPSATGTAGSSKFDPKLAAEDLNYILADAAKMYSLPLIASRNAQGRRSSHSDADESNQSRVPPPRTASQNASIAGTNNLIDDLIRDYKSKYND